MLFYIGKATGGNHQDDGLASHFVYVATIVLVYVYMCIIIFVSAHNILVFEAKYFIN